MGVLASALLKSKRTEVSPVSAGAVAGAAGVLFLESEPLKLREAGLAGAWTTGGPPMPALYMCANLDGPSGTAVPERVIMLSTGPTVTEERRHHVDQR